MLTLNQNQAETALRCAELVTALRQLCQNGGTIPLWDGKPAVKIRDVKTLTQKRGSIVEYHTRFYHLSEAARKALDQAHLLPWGV